MSAQIPEEIHALKGTRATRAAAKESTFENGKPKMPDDLSENQQIAWKEVVKLLAPRCTLTKGDVPALRLYAQNFARHKALLAAIEEDGEVIEQPLLDSSGVCHTKKILHPASKQASTVSAFLRNMLREFSLTPATREKTKPAAPPAPKADEIVPGSARDLRRQLEQQAAEEESSSEPEEN
jgi:P27 family predicted phage terminase small subunit